MRKLVISGIALFGAMFLTSCVSGNVEYLPALKAEKISATAYVPISPDPTIDKGGLPAFGVMSKPLFEDDYEASITELYNKINFTAMVHHAFTENQPLSEKRVEIHTKGDLFSKIAVQSVEKSAEDERAPDYDYSIFQGKIGDSYVLEYRVREWGFFAYGSKTVLKYSVSIIDVKSNSIVWRKNDDMTNSIDFGITGGWDDVTQELVEQSLQELLKESFEDIQSELNKE